MTALHSELEATGPRGEQTGASGQLIPDQNKEIISGVTALLLCILGVPVTKEPSPADRLAAHDSQG